MNVKILDKIDKNVLRELGEGAVSITADIKLARSQVMRDVAAFHQWSWLENVPISLSTDSGKTYITKPDYFGEEISIYVDSGGMEIRYISPQEYARKIASSTSSNTKPTYYTLEGGRIMFYHPLTSGNSVTIFGTINADQVSDDNDKPIEGIEVKISDHFQSIIERGILEKVDSDNRKKAEWGAFYYRDLKIKRTMDRRSRGRSIRSIKDKAVLSSRRFLQG